MKKVASSMQVNQDTPWYSFGTIEELMKKIKEVRKNLREMLKMTDKEKKVK